MTLQLNHGFIPRNYDIFSGLDVDKTSMSVNFLDHGEMIKSMRIPHNAEHLLNYVRRHFPTKRVAFAYEAGPTGYGLYDRLTTQGYTCLVVSPSMIPTAPGQMVKTNRLDSKKIAENLRGGQLKSIHIPSDSYRQLRHLIQLRDTFVRQATAAKCRIKALLLFEGIPFPEAPANSQWSKIVITELEGLACNKAVHFKLNHLLSSLEFAHKQVLETTREMHRFCLEDTELNTCIRYLMSIPGVGYISASHFLARIGDWRQIKNSRQISSFLGLVPRENSTGDSVDRGSITRSGDAYLRNKLVQCAWSAIRKDPELREFYRRIHQRHPRAIAARKAIVAVTHKLATRMFAVLREQKSYVVQQTVESRPLTEEETALPKEETRQQAESGTLSEF